jgi:predicted RNA-binding Zn ribbon-like protein
MTPEQWQVVRRVFEAAVELPPADRAAHVEAACAGDPGLRAEVESLLDAHAGAESFLAEPAAVLGNAPGPRRSVVAAGQAVGRCRVLALLGAGWMGQVYLAEDPALARRIALKLLPRAPSADPDRLRRFRQEARAASALSHPNVCVVHEIGEATDVAGDTRHYIAMEHVPGESLRQRIDRHHAAGTRMPLEEALDLVQQVAAGLQAAHPLRDVLERVVTEVAATEVSAEALAAFNTELASALPRLRVERGSPDGTALALTWRGWGQELECVLWPVVWDAAQLLGSDDLGKVRVCPGPHCGWAFVDRSRNGLRRWCQTGVCGARAKSRRHYQRKRAATRTSEPRAE